METTPQLNFEYVPPKWNVDKLEGAVLHCLQVCGPLSGAAINAFCQRYAYERNKKLPEDYGTRSLLPRMLRARKVFRISEKLYALNPLLPFDANARLRLDAFWTFLENMEVSISQALLSGHRRRRFLTSKTTESITLSAAKTMEFSRWAWLQTLSFTWRTCSRQVRA